MVLSDALVEEIFQTLIQLPYRSVEQLIVKMRAEVAAHSAPKDMQQANEKTVAEIAEREGVGKSIPAEIAKFTRMPKKDK
jgi:hypothetical protein